MAPADGRPVHARSAGAGGDAVAPGVQPDAVRPGASPRLHRRPARERVHMDGRAVRCGDRARDRGREQPVLRVLRVRRPRRRVPRGPPARAAGHGDQRAAVSRAHPGLAPLGPDLLHHAPRVHRHHRVPGRIPRRAATRPRGEAARVRVGDTARAHRALAARRDRAGPRGRERAARDVPPAPPARRAGEGAARADGAPGGRQSRARRPAHVHPVAHRPGGGARPRSRQRPDAFHGARAVRRLRCRCSSTRSRSCSKARATSRCTRVRIPPRSRSSTRVSRCRSPSTTTASGFPRERPRRGPSRRARSSWAVRFAWGHPTTPGATSRCSFPRPEGDAASPSHRHRRRSRALPPGPAVDVREPPPERHRGGRGRDRVGGGAHPGRHALRRPASRPPDGPQRTRRHRELRPPRPGGRGHGQPGYRRSPGGDPCRRARGGVQALRRGVPGRGAPHRARRDTSGSRRRCRAS